MQEKDYKNLKEKIWKEIQKKNIKPVAKWKFQLKEILIWTLFIFSIILGSFAFSAILLELFNADWDIYTHFTDSFLEYTLTVLPFFWILFLIIILIIAYINFQYTKKGYKYSLPLFFLISISSSILIGIIFYNLNLSHIVNDLTYKYIDPDNRILITRREIIWNKNENGLIAGKLTKMINPNTIEIEDFHHKKWIINIKKAKIINSQDIYLNSIIKIIGKVKGKNLFEAYEIRPWNKIYFHIFINDENTPHIFEIK